MGDSAIKTFVGLLRSVPPTEPILLLGVMERLTEGEDKDTQDYNAHLEAKMVRDLFGYSLKNQYNLVRPNSEAREEYFTAMIEYIRKAPSEFPDQENRKRRKLEELPVAIAEESPKAAPSKADLKAQKRKDRQTLNLLKLQIQGVMDQLKLKYKKFRTPVVEDRDIAYLYDEQNPQVLTTDLSEEQRQQQLMYRPFELEKDDKGITGLREVATGKFYYNIEIVTIEKRLSNGYYKRPKDFLADIKRLAKDAKMSGDQDRTLKANEMLANVEVDMTTLEQTQPALIAECEAVYERDQERERVRLAKVREAERMGQQVPVIMPNVPPPDASKTTTETTGPVVLGQEIPGVRPPLFPMTPSRLYGPPGTNSNPWSTTNGSHPSHHTNGSTVPSRPREDSEMLDSPELYEPGTQSYPQGVAGSPDLNPNTQGEYTQRSAHTRVAQGSQVENYRNSASTTTSGQKTSDKSNRSSGPYSLGTQMSNGLHEHTSQQHPESLAGSQLPDTQEQHFESQVALGDVANSQSQSSQSQSQAMPPPPTHTPAAAGGRRTSDINAVLNEPANPTTAATSASAPPRVIVEATLLANFHRELVDRSSGLSVEQLEQVNAGMMEAVWRGRGNWNRNAVLREVMEAFNETVKDIEAVQAVLGPSQERE